MNPKNRLFIGIAVLLLGVGMLAYRGIYVTKEETVLKVGTLDVKARTQERVPLPPALSWVLVASGAILVLSGALARKA